MKEDTYGLMLNVVDDALLAADDAVKAARSAEAAASRISEPVVTLVKVAAARCETVADKLISTGAFDGVERASLVNELQNSGPEGHLKIMEKLASKAMFILDSEELGGTLVEKSANITHAEAEVAGSTAHWRQALDEAKAEFN